MIDSDTVFFIFYLYFQNLPKNKALYWMCCPRMNDI